MTTVSSKAPVQKEEKGDENDTFDPLTLLLRLLPRNLKKLYLGLRRAFQIHEIPLQYLPPKLTHFGPLQINCEYFANGYRVGSPFTRLQKFVDEGCVFPESIHHVNIVLGGGHSLEPEWGVGAGSSGRLESSSYTPKDVVDVILKMFPGLQNRDTGTVEIGLSVTPEIAVKMGYTDYMDGADRMGHYYLCTSVDKITPIQAGNLKFIRAVWQEFVDRLPVVYSLPPDCRQSRRGRREPQIRRRADRTVIPRGGHIMQKRLYHHTHSILHTLVAVYIISYYITLSL